MLATGAIKYQAPASVDLNHYKNDSQRLLLNLLNKHECSKIIVWDDKLIGPFEFVANTTILKKHDVTQMHRLSTVRGNQFNTSIDRVLYLLRKDYSALEYVANVLRNTDKSSFSKTSLIFVPQKCVSSINFLKQNKVDTDKLHSIEELPIQMYVMDSDLLSMEYNFAFRQINLNKDYSCIKNIVDSLTTIQDLYGPIYKISGQGECAEIVMKQLVSRQKLAQAKADGLAANGLTGCQLPVAPKIHQLLLIDRSVDLLTPLLTQLTYEGILDEVFGIEQGRVELPTNKKVYRLHSSEELYAKLRDTHINAVAQTLKQTARGLQAEYDESQSKVKTVHEMRKIVQRIPYLKKTKESHANHLNMAELISKRTLEYDFIYGLRIEHELLQEGRIGHVIPEIDIKLMRQEDPIHILRLICAHSMTSNGLKPKVCEHYKRELIQNSGFEYLTLLNDLKTINIFLDQEREVDQFSQQRDRFNLITENVDEINPNHPSYVYGGYLPYTIYLARLIAQSDSIQLPKPGFSKTNKPYVGPASGDEPRVVLVYFIGGCTFAEISALRFISQQEENNCEFLVATTNICNGNTFLQSIWQPD